MWSRTTFYSALAALALLSGELAGDSLQAQETAPSPTPPTESWKLRQYLKLHIAGGRIVISQAEAGQNRTVLSGDADSPTHRELHVQARAGGCVVAYEASDPAGKMTLTLCPRGKLTLVSTPAEAKRVPVRYVQPAEGDVTLTVGTQTPVSHSAPSLWHLLFCQREVCREHLLPLLLTLQPDWNLQTQFDDVEAALVEAAQLDEPAADARHWQALVDDLAASSFRTRQAADRKLREAGPTAAIWLSKLSKQHLSSEQRTRVASICRANTPVTLDTPQYAAALLLHEPTVWQTLLADKKQNAAASDYLSRLQNQR